MATKPLKIFELPPEEAEKEKKKMRVQRAQKEVGPSMEVASPAPVKTRAARRDYGFTPGCKIVLSEEKTYRGKRGDVYQILRKFNGKPAEKFFEAIQPMLENEAPRGWLRFYVEDGAVVLAA